jgi:hypothetical protein
MVALLECAASHLKHKQIFDGAVPGRTAHQAYSEFQ